MKKILLVFMILFNFTFSFTYQYNGQTFSIEDKKIEKAFNIGIDNFIQQYGEYINGEELKILIFSNILEQEVLLNSSFGKKIIIPTKDVEEQFNTVKSEFSDDISFYKALQFEGLTKVTLLKEIENNLKLEKVREAIESQVKVTENELKSYYEENKFNSFFIDKSYEDIKGDIKESLLAKKKGEALRYFIESEKSKVILQKNSSYSNYYSKVVYEKEGFKFTNVDLANKKIMIRIQGVSDEELLNEIAKEAIDIELKVVKEAKKLKLKIPEKLSKDDQISAYREAYQKYLINTTKVPEKEIEEYFNTNTDKYFIPEMYDIKLIELAIVPSDFEKSEAREKAQSILNLALEGENFSELAKQYSEDGSAQNGGQLGWFSRGQMVEPFEDECFSGKVGKVVPHLVETEFGYHIIKVEDKKSDGSEVYASHIIITPKISDVTIQGTTKKIQELMKEIKSGETTLEKVSKDFSIMPDTLNFKNIKKGAYIEGVGQDNLLLDAISSSKLNELSYVIGERAFIFIKTRHINSVEPTLENSIERVKYDLVREKVGEKLSEMYK